MSHSSTDDRTSDRVGRASTRGILYSIGEALSDDRARKDAKGLRIPVADDFFERGRPWAVPLTDEEEAEAERLRGDPVPADRTLYLWAWVKCVYQNRHLDGYRLCFDLGQAQGKSRFHARVEVPEIDFQPLETRTGYFDPDEIRSAVSTARARCDEALSDLPPDTERRDDGRLVIDRADVRRVRPGGRHAPCPSGRRARHGARCA
jgi:hypothetical protein